MTKLKTTRNEAGRGEGGDLLLARGEHMALRLWDNEAPTDDKPEHEAPYETLGYVISGRAELTVNGETLTLQPGDSYRVPKGARHAYRILEPFTAVEATNPPAGT